MNSYTYNTNITIFKVSRRNWTAWNITVMNLNITIYWVIPIFTVSQERKLPFMSTLISHKNCYLKHCLSWSFPTFTSEIIYETVSGKKNWNSSTNLNDIWIIHISSLSASMSFFCPPNIWYSFCIWFAQTKKQQKKPHKWVTLFPLLLSKEAAELLLRLGRSGQEIQFWDKQGRAREKV